MMPYLSRYPLRTNSKHLSQTDLIRWRCFKTHLFQKEPENPANLIRILGKEKTIPRKKNFQKFLASKKPSVEETVGGKSVTHDVVTDVNSTIDASIDEGVSNLFLLRDSSTPEDRVPKPDPSRYIVLQRDREGEREGEREREGNIYIYIHTHTHTYTYTHAQIHIGSGQRWTGWTWRIGGRRGRTRRL